MKSMLGSGAETGGGGPKSVEGGIREGFMLKRKEREGVGGGRHMKKYSIVEQGCTSREWKAAGYTGRAGRVTGA